LRHRVPPKWRYKALLIIYLIIFSQSLKMASSKSKHVAAFF